MAVPALTGRTVSTILKKWKLTRLPMQDANLKKPKASTVASLAMANLAKVKVRAENLAAARIQLLLLLPPPVPSGLQQQLLQAC